jgi:RNA polymerase sigma factor (sigma-70 family)
MGEFGPDSYSQFEDTDPTNREETFDAKDISANFRQLPSAPSTQDSDENPAADPDLDSDSNTTFCQDQPVSTTDSFSPSSAPDESPQFQALKWINKIIAPGSKRSRFLLFLATKLDHPFTAEEVCAGTGLTHREISNIAIQLEQILAKNYQPFVINPIAPYCLKVNPFGPTETPPDPNPDIEYSDQEKALAVAWTNTHAKEKKEGFTKSIMLLLAQNLGKALSITEIAKTIGQSEQKTGMKLGSLSQKAYINSPYSLETFRKSGKWRLTINQNKTVEDFTDIEYSAKDKKEANDWFEENLTQQHQQKKLAQILTKNMGKFTKLSDLCKKISDLNPIYISNLARVLELNLKRMKAPYRVEKLYAQYRIIRTDSKPETDEETATKTPEAIPQTPATEWITKLFNPTSKRAKLLFFLASRLDTPTTAEEICAGTGLSKTSVYNCARDIQKILEGYSHPFVFINQAPYLLKANPEYDEEFALNPDIKYTDAQKLTAIAWSKTHWETGYSKKIAIFLAQNLGTTVTIDQVAKAVNKSHKQVGLVLGNLACGKYKDSPYELTSYNRTGKWRLTIRENQPVPEFSDIPYNDLDKKEAAEWSTSNLSRARLQELSAIFIEHMGSFITPDDVEKVMTSLKRTSITSLVSDLASTFEQMKAPYQIEKLHGKYRLIKTVPTLNETSEYNTWFTALTHPATITYAILELIGENKPRTTFQIADIVTTLNERTTKDDPIKENINEKRVTKALERLAKSLPENSPYQVTGSQEKGYQIIRTPLSEKPSNKEVSLIPVEEEVAPPKLAPRPRYVSRAGGQIYDALNREINQLPRLSHEENVRLRMLAGPIGDDVEETDLTNLAAFEELVMGNFRLIRVIANIFVKGFTRMSYEDFVTIGYLGLRRGCLRFDPEKGKLVTIACHHIRQKMGRANNRTKSDVVIELKALTGINIIDRAETQLKESGQAVTRENIAAITGKTAAQVEQLQLLALPAFSFDNSDRKRENGTKVLSPDRKIANQTDTIEELTRSTHENYLLKELYRAFCQILGIKTSRQIPLSKVRSEAMAEIFNIHGKTKKEILLRRDLYIYMRNAGLEILYAGADGTSWGSTSGEDIGEDVGLSRERVSQIVAKIFEGIREALEANKIAIPTIEALEAIGEKPGTLNGRKQIKAAVNAALEEDTEAQDDTDDAEDTTDTADIVITDETETPLTKLAPIRKKDLRPSLKASPTFEAWKKEILGKTNHPIIAKTILNNLGGLPAGEKSTPDRIVQVLRMKEKYENLVLNKTDQELLTDILTTLSGIEGLQSDSFELTFERDSSEFWVIDNSTITVSDDSPETIQETISNELIQAVGV